MTEETKDLRSSWRSRQKQHGASPRSVLMKGLHARLNESIDLWHRDVLKRLLESIAPGDAGAFVLDIGCGYGRLAGEALRAGMIPVGVDFTPGFCADFAKAHGSAVCADQAQLPFAAATFQAAYSVTSLMYLDLDRSRAALLEMDRCVKPGGVVLLLEPCREFNSLVRTLVPGKKAEQLAMPGFGLEELHSIIPEGWTALGAGHCRWLTLLLPILSLVSAWPAVYRPLSGLARRLDCPRLNGRPLHGKLALYRWVICRTRA